MELGGLQVTMAPPAGAEVTLAIGVNGADGAPRMVTGLDVATGPVARALEALTVKSYWSPWTRPENVVAVPGTCTGVPEVIVVVFTGVTV